MFGASFDGVLSNGERRRFGYSGRCRQWDILSFLPRWETRQHNDLHYCVSNEYREFSS